MFSSSTLTRPEFELAAKAFIRKYNAPGLSGLIAAQHRGWEWKNHPLVPGYGYMFRTVLLFTRARHSALDDADEDLLPETDEEPDDTESSASAALDHLVCSQSVVFSPTFQVPAFYFTIHDSTGSPLPLVDILKSSLFRRHSFPENSATTSFALSLPDQNLPLLSQGDHPTLGTPSWYIHPCETASAIAELTEEINSESTMSEQEMSEEVSMVRWMEVWFMVLGSTVDLHS